MCKVTVGNVAVLLFLGVPMAGGATVRTLPPGVTYMDEPIVVTAAESGLVIEGAADGSSVLSGARPVKGLAFAALSNGIFAAAWEAGPVAPDRLFVNGVGYAMARYPNRNPGDGRNVYDVWKLGEKTPHDALAPARVSRWAHPEDGYLHTLHEYLWGDLHWRIVGRRPDGTLETVGGWQNNRPTGPHPVYRYVENVREELDAPGEWFYDVRERRLYVVPLPGTDLSAARIEAVRLTNLLSVRGTAAAPVRNLVVRNVAFRHTARTFMENRERMLRSDWTVSRQAAVTLAGTEDCRLENCTFEDLGGNAVVIDGSNCRATVTGCRFAEIGASGVAVLGRVSAVRSPLFDNTARHDLATVDRTPGPCGGDYPRDCLVDDCLIVRTGREEKQTAGVTIDIAARVTVRDCTVAGVPRAGINIGDGCFGGHVIEGCDVFDTVLETGDHGAFNSWGRDRFWRGSLEEMDPLMDTMPGLVRADCVARNVIRNSRWRCDHGWDIDLDDGSSFYDIVSNVCLAGGIKLREGFRRTCRGNYCANNGLHPHCWLRSGGDTVEGNVFFMAPYPAGRTDFCKATLDGDVGIRPGEEAAYPVPAGTFGVRSARLRALAPSPKIPKLRSRMSAARRPLPTRCVGAAVWREFDVVREHSAYALPADARGWVLESGPQPPFEKGDIVLCEDPSAITFPAKVVRKRQQIVLTGQSR